MWMKFSSFMNVYLNVLDWLYNSVYLVVVFYLENPLRMI